MKIKIKGIEKEIIIKPAPKGSYFYDVEGLVIFPTFIAFAASEDDGIITLPICGYEDETLYPEDIHNDVGVADFYAIVKGRYKVYNNTIEEAVETTINLFRAHETTILPYVYEYIKDKKYLEIVNEKPNE